jgi:chitinase
VTAPGDGSRYAAPATISIDAAVTPNGHSITTVQFYNGTTLLGADTNAPYNYTWTNVIAGSYAINARAVYDSGGSVASAPVNIAVLGRPSRPVGLHVVGP